MTLDELIARAASTYRFRARGPQESRTHYRRALIAHVRQRDFAMAHELVVGRAQAEWTADDVARFREFMLSRDRSPSALPHVVALECTTLGQCPAADVTDETLLRIGETLLGAFRGMREALPPGSDMPILLNVLQTDGELFYALLDRAQRVAVVKLLARTRPMFGFALLCDVFVHGVSHEDETAQRATKRDALVAHVGSRTQRRMLVRPYTIGAGGRVTFDDPPPPDVDKAAVASGTLHDPYADVFALDAPTERPQ